VTDKRLSVIVTNPASSFFNDPNCGVEKKMSKTAEAGVDGNGSLQGPVSISSVFNSLGNNNWEPSSRRKELTMPGPDPNQLLMPRPGMSLVVR